VGKNERPPAKPNVAFGCRKDTRGDVLNYLKKKDDLGTSKVVKDLKKK